MKILIMALFLSLFAGTLACHNYDIKSEQTALISIDETFEQAFVKSIKSDSVALQDGKIIIYANPQALQIFLRTFTTGALAFFGLGCTAISVLSSRDDLLTRGIFGMIGGVTCVFGARSGYHLLDCLHKKMTKVPYLILDQEGIVLLKEKKIPWSLVKQVEADRKFLTFGYYGYWTTTLSLNDQFGTSLLEILTYPGRSFLSIPVSNFTALVNHYLQNHATLSSVN